jgi:hypothetical protein
MSFSQIIEVTFGLIIIYYILGAIVSLITQIAMESGQTRGRALEEQLKRLTGAATLDLKNLPQIKSLQPIRYAHWWNVFGARTEEKKVEKIPVDTLVDAFFDMTGLTSKAALGADELSTLVDKLPESEGKQAMLDWIHQGVTSLSALRTRSRDFAAGLLNQAALTFRARARSFVIVLSIVVTALFGVDSVQLAKDLWTDAGLRALAAQQAQAAASQPQTAPGLSSLVDQLGTLSFHIGWWNIPGLPTTSSTNDWINFVALKLLGLAITALAVSQGSSFWYDILKRLTGSASGPSGTSTGGGVGGALG